MSKVNNRLRDEAIAHSLFVSRYGTGAAKRMVKILNDSDAELSARLLVALEELPRESFTVTRLESLLDSVRQVNQTAVQGAFGTLSDELLAFASHEAGYQHDLFSELLPEAVLRHYPLAAVTPDMAYAAAMSRPFQGRLLKEWAESLEADRLTRVMNAVRSGYMAGDTTEQIARKVRGSAAANRQDGALQMSRANAMSIAKTAVSHVAAVARDSFAQANSDILECKQWLSTLDNRTTPTCIIRDRKKYTLDDKPLGHKIPYLQGPGRIHFCCRSTETLVTKSWRELGIDSDEMSPGTRASMDGQVPEDTTYLEWLARQSPERQDQVLGTERGRMYRAGELRLGEMFTDKGEWLTLAQLKALSASKQAGKSPGFSLAGAQSVAEIEQGMRGIIADEIRFPEGTTLESARIAAGAMQDVIERFGLPPVSSFGEIPGLKVTAAGAYVSESKSVHIAGWALKPDEWDYLRERSAGIDMIMMVRGTTASLPAITEVVERTPEFLPYVAVPSVRGAVWHEMGHHLYYQMPEVGQLVESAYDDGWWRTMSAYAGESPKELFAETVALFFSGENDHAIEPEILQWLKTHSRT